MNDKKVMFKVPDREDPYVSIGKYIRDHITAIEDIIAVIELDGIETNELFMVDMAEDGYFIWEYDWWEGENSVALIDFFPVSEAINANSSPELADIKIGKSKSGITMWYECGYCGESVDIGDKFCRNCGRRLIYE